MNNTAKDYAKLVRRVAEEVNDERSSKCGYDLLMGLEKGDSAERAKAWERYLKEYEEGEGYTSEERDGCWVPARTL